jgi:hypothetical protein
MTGVCIYPAPPSLRAVNTHNQAGEGVHQTTMETMELARGIVFWCSALVVSTCVSQAFPSYKNAAPERKIEWHAYAVSTIHTLFTLWTAVRNILHDEEWTPAYLCEGRVDWRSWCFSVTIAYFCVDIVLMMVAKMVAKDPGYRMDLSLVFHHFFVGGSIVLSMHYSYVTWFLAVLLFNELSTLFLNFRWFLLTSGMENHKLFMTNGAIFTVTFFFCRVCLLPILFFFYWKRAGLCLETHQADIPLSFKALAFCNFPLLWVLNCFWFVKIIRGVLKALNGKGE